MKKLIMVFFMLMSISFAASAATLGQSFVNAMMPGALPKGQTMAIIPRDIVIGSITTGYGKK